MHKGLPHHAETSASLSVSVQRAFDHLDDHTRVFEHMSRRSWRMAWGRMELQLDEQRGRAVGSRIRVVGRAFGLRLELEEVVTEYERPVRKVWETVGTPRLLVIGPYRMGFTLSPQAGAPGTDKIRLTVSIDYLFPERGLPWLLGQLLGHWYARWCTARIVADAARSLGPSGTQALSG